MIMKPWALDKKALGRINKLPANQREFGFASYHHFYYNSFKVPAICSFVIYGMFLLLILAAAINNLLKWSAPSLHAKCKQRLRLLRAHVFEHPLISHKHSSVVAFPFLKWLTLQLPLRGEAFIIFCLSLINFLPLVAFYDFYVGHNTIFPAVATSKRDQICRHLADRTGVLGVAQLPLLVLMASKRTPVAIVSGLGMNNLILYHRWISRWFWAHITIHAGAYTAVYIRRDRLDELLEETYIRWGIAGLAMMFGLVFFSLRALRERSYEVFVMLHITMAFFAVLGTYLHIALIESPRFQLFKVLTEITAVLWTFDRLVRFANRMWLSFSSPRLSTSSKKPASALIKCASAQIRSYGKEYSRLRISVPSSKLRFADQHRMMGGIAGGDDIRVTIPRLQWVGEHPFTVFAVGRQADDPAMGYIDLVIKTEAGLTRRLANHASKANDVEVAGVQGDKSKVAVMIEGLFGVKPDVQEATELVLVAGGIAITFCWPLFVAAVKASATSRLTSCKLIWIVRQQSTLAVLQEAFDELVHEMHAIEASKRCHFSMDIYVTSTGQKGSKSSDGPSRTGSSTPDSYSKEMPLESPQLDKSSTPSVELAEGIVELPKVPQETQASDEKGQSGLFADGVNGALIKVRHFSGRPPVLAEALFGHLEQESLRESRGLTVGLCGPPSLCDDVRYETVSLLKKGIHVELVEDCFTW
ncbi:related to FRE4-Ferric reductase [Sporisorium reilianum SRZ2]|uniref:Related to FRE4-Ferric reductase n=1 Tax=Sporisorium reilianum (strain SRZ2) TaxID=999809 RepID=E6ZSL9_SPORE|nr:related to FRE4-Ferric reductase [Sporisorium reilianum SRZ2]